MKIIFFGTPAIAAEVAAYLEQRAEVLAVVTQPDRPKGRSGKPQPSPVKEFALEKGIPIYQPERASDPSFITEMASWRADFFVVVAYGQILRQALLDLPLYEPINLHGSLLPKYRGAAPIQRAIIEGEKRTGIAVMKMVREMDAGDVYAMQELIIGPDETAGELARRMAEVGGPLLWEALSSIMEGAGQPIPQDPAKVTFAHKIETEECRIDWSRPAEQVHNLIRGVSPHPGAWTRASLSGEAKRMKIFRTSLLQEPREAPGSVIPLSRREFAIACGLGAVQIHSLQLEGKKAISSEAFLQGVSLEGNSFFILNDF